MNNNLTLQSKQPAGRHRIEPVEIAKLLISFIQVVMSDSVSVKVRSLAPLLSVLRFRKGPIWSTGEMRTGGDKSTCSENNLF